MEGDDHRNEGEVPSSPSDFYGSDVPTSNPPLLPLGDRAPDPPNKPSLSTFGASEEDNIGDGDGDDMSLEMDLSSDSGSITAGSPASVPIPDPETLQGQKRKASNIEDGSADDASDLEERVKKRKLSPTQALHGVRTGVARLPPELWQQVFLRLPPAILLRCLRVCKAFNVFLTSMKAPPSHGKKGPGPHEVRVLDSESIWSQSRRLWFPPNFPRPLRRCTELQMLRLLTGKACQFCGRLSAPQPATTYFSAGPGPEGVRIVWAFGIRTCGRCLQAIVLRDVDILLSSAAALRQGLPYAFITPELHLIPDTTRQLPGGIPSHLRANKVYYRQDVEEIERQFEDAKSLGEGAADEWRKGLPAIGRESMVDASRWEKWESQVQLPSDLGEVLRQYDLSSFPRCLEKTQSRSVGVTSTQPAMSRNGFPEKMQHPPHSYGRGFNAPVDAHSQPQQLLYVEKVQRQPHEVEQARQTRKFDIEKRCMDLEPPLHANVLQHIAAFQAAMQITTPMTDRSWEMLKPRILAEREQAELIEHRKAEQLAALQAALPSTTMELAYQRPAKEVYDHEYEHAQEPLRKKLGEYADDFINGQWRGGQALDRDSVPLFAPRCLLFVRKRYLEEKQAQQLSGTEATQDSERSNRSSSPPEPFLSLDNMKWVQDNKIRPLTDNYRREMFVCSGCVDERKPKWFAFEGLVQHFGAKHTTAFSKGNIVVHWQTAEWPDESPFAEDPTHWLNQERKSRSFKERRHHVRGTPQTSYQGAFPSPKSTPILLSDLPFFSSGAQHPPPASNGQLHSRDGYGPAQTGAPSQNSGSDAALHRQVPAETLASFSHDAQLNKLATDAGTIWDGLDGIKNHLDCVRFHTVIHHVVTRFREQFHKMPELDLLTDALATNARMKPIKNATGLACKICVESQTDGSASYQSYYRRISSVKLYNPSSLITHFKIMHLSETPYLDWTRDMVELPEAQLVTDLRRSSGMDEDKLAMIAAAFPDAFTTPLSRTGPTTKSQLDPGPDSGLMKRLIDRFIKKDSQPKKKKGQHHGQNGTPAREGSNELGKDEYDPTKPMILQGKEQELDPARFDTDVARASTTINSKPPDNVFNLAPETLDALSNLTALIAPTTQQAEVLAESRSPSVGLPDSPRLRTSVAPAAALPGNGLPAVAPDIASILASLTGQAQPLQTRASTSSSTMRPTSALQHPQAEVLPPTRYAPYHEIQEDVRRSSSYNWSANVYPSSALPSPAYAGQDLQAALRRSSQDLQAVVTNNTTSCDKNRHSAYPSQQYQPATRPPPHYRYVYEEARPTPTGPSPPHPVHAGPAPVQYVQREPARVEFRYEPAPPPKPIYIDEYGRRVELVPIDAAPAPVQYLPHPFERQHQSQAPQPQPQYYGSPAEQAHHTAPPPLYPYASYAQQRYYEQPQGTPATSPRAHYVYDDGSRASVPRNQNI